MWLALLVLAGATLPAQWVNDPKPGVELPAGVTHRTYRSTVMNCDVGYLIYLPPDYAAALVSG
jgi:hypothetical protein